MAIPRIAVIFFDRDRDRERITARLNRDNSQISKILFFYYWFVVGYNRMGGLAVSNLDRDRDRDAVNRETATAIRGMDVET